MRAAIATTGLWADTNARLTTEVCAALVRAGYVGVFRYVPLPRNSALGDISSDEAQAITTAGLQLGLVQHPRSPANNVIAQHSGLQDGMAASDAARATGYPPGCHLFLDIEGVTGNATQVALYCNGWSTQVAADGYGCGLYVGYSAILTADQLYQLPRFNRYWKDAGPRAVSTRGFCIEQHSGEVVIAGVKFDVDTVEADQLGDLPMVAC